MYSAGRSDGGPDHVHSQINNKPDGQYDDHYKGYDQIAYFSLNDVFLTTVTAFAFGHDYALFIR